MYERDRLMAAFSRHAFRARVRVDAQHAERRAANQAMRTPRCVIFCA